VFLSCCDELCVVPRASWDGSRAAKGDESRAAEELSQRLLDVSVLVVGSAREKLERV